MTGQTWKAHRGPADIIGHCEMRIFRKEKKKNSADKDTDLMRGAKLRHCAVEHVEVVEEIDGLERRSPCWRRLARQA